MNKERIFANFLVAFCTAQLAVSFSGIDGKGFALALWVALMQGALAAALEWKKEVEGGGGTLPTLTLF